ncbi:MAG: AMIN domain-containing protein [Deltaproteobacteria bacterium]|jgi:hypothetical protein|nr:AMIN domain-containing protein [Deltaproteobacteria bacterium]
MNKYITLLLLGVVLAAMLLVFGVHMNKFSDGNGQTETVVAENAAAEAGASDSKPDEAAAQSTSQGASSDASASAAPNASSDASVNVSTASGRIENGQTLAETRAQASAQMIEAAQNAPADPAQSGTPAQGSARQNQSTASVDQSRNTPGAAQNPNTANAASNQPSSGIVQEPGAANAAQAQSTVQGQSAASTAPRQSVAQNQPTASATQSQSAVTAAQNKPTASAAQSQPVATPAKPLSITHGKGSIKSMALKFRGKGLYLAIEADSPMPAKYFLLHQPERLVVDLPGTWKNISLPTVPQNLLVSKIRQGRQPDSDRFVLDLTRPLKVHSLVRISDTKVEIVFE